MWYPMAVDRNPRKIKNVAVKKSEHWLDRSREKLRNSQLLPRLIRYVCADPQAEDPKERPEAIMTTDQARTALALAKKIMPDIAAQTIVVHDTREKHPRDMRLAELYDACMQQIDRSENPTSPTQH